MTYTLQSPKQIAVRIIGKMFGGKGSGNIGHSGLAGVHGGSSKDGGGGSLKSMKQINKFRSYEEASFKQAGIDINEKRFEIKKDLPKDIYAKLNPSYKKQVDAKTDRPTAETSTSVPILIRGKDGYEVIDGSHALAGKLKKNESIEDAIAGGGKTYFRSGSLDDPHERGVFMVSKKEVAQVYGKNVLEYTININAKEKKHDNQRTLYRELFKDKNFADLPYASAKYVPASKLPDIIKTGGSLDKMKWQREIDRRIKTRLKKRGYDIIRYIKPIGMEAKGSEELQVLNTKMMDKVG